MKRFTLRELLLFISALAIGLSVNAWTNYSLRADIREREQYINELEKYARSNESELAAKETKLSEATAKELKILQQIMDWEASGDLKPGIGVGFIAADIRRNGIICELIPTVETLPRPKRVQ